MPTKHAEVVVGIAEHHVERHSAVELSEVLLDINTALKDEIYDVQITIASAAASTVVQTQ